MSSLAAPPTTLEPTEWLVLFQGETAKQSWFLDRAEPGFRHVSMLRWLAPMDLWLAIDPTFQRLDIELISDGEAAKRLAVTRQAPKGAVLRCMTGEEGRMPAWPGLSCVAVVAAVLGLPRCPMTPFRLYNDLLNRGAVPLEPKESDNGPV